MEEFLEKFCDLDSEVDDKSISDKDSLDNHLFVPKKELDEDIQRNSDEINIEHPSTT